MARTRCASGRGFTLIELMITVLIIGILSTLAIYGMNQYVRSSKMSEAQTIVGDIAAAQEQFEMETHAYLNVTGGVGDDDFYPNNGFDGTIQTQWGAADGCQGVDFSTNTVNCIVNFNTLGVEAKGPVRFRYASTAYTAAAGIPPTPHITNYNPSGVAATEDGYVVVAVSDLDNDGGLMTAVITSKMSTHLHAENVGQ